MEPSPSSSRPPRRTSAPPKRRRGSLAVILEPNAGALRLLDLLEKTDMELRAAQLSAGVAVEDEGSKPTATRADGKVATRE